MFRFLSSCHYAHILHIKKQEQNMFFNSIAPFCPSGRRRRQTVLKWLLLACTDRGGEESAQLSHINCASYFKPLTLMSDDVFHALFLFLELCSQYFSLSSLLQRTGSGRVTYSCCCYCCCLLSLSLSLSLSLFLSLSLY
jgi:hypothetical protein